MSPAESGVSVAARSGRHRDRRIRDVRGDRGGCCQVQSGRRDRSNSFEGTTQGEERAEQTQDRRQHGDASQGPHVAPQPLAFDAVRQRHRSLEVGGGPAPAADRSQAPLEPPDSGSLTMIESPTAIEPSLVQSIEKPGRELGGNDLVLPEPGESFDEHSHPEAGAGCHAPPRHPVRGRRVNIPGDQSTSRPSRQLDRELQSRSAVADARSANVGSLGR